MRQILSISDQLAPLLQAVRKSAGLSQTELARRLNLSQSRMSAMAAESCLHASGPTAVHLCLPAIGARGANQRCARKQAVKPNRTGVVNDGSPFPLPHYLRPDQ
jgi:hypothetical protein